MNHREQAGYPGETYQFEITILSLDYTPIPEPTTLTLLGLGSLALVVVRQRR